MTQMPPTLEKPFDLKGYPHRKFRREVSLGEYEKAQRTNLGYGLGKTIEEEKNVLGAAKKAYALNLKLGRIDEAMRIKQEYFLRVNSNKHLTLLSKKIEKTIKNYNNAQIENSDNALECLKLTNKKYRAKTVLDKISSYLPSSSKVDSTVSYLRAVGGKIFHSKRKQQKAENLETILQAA